MGRFIEDANTRRQIFHSLSKLGCGLQEFNSRKLHLKRVGIIVTTFEKTRIHFNGDVSAAVAVVVAKAPYYIPLSSKKGQAKLMTTVFFVHSLKKVINYLRGNSGLVLLFLHLLEIALM